MKKLLLGCLGTAILFAACSGFLVWVLIFRELPTLDAEMSIPSETTRGSAIAMTVTVTNPHDKPITLDSIDVADSFLEGFQVTSIDPKPVTTMHVLSLRSWTFSESVAPGDELVVRFNLKAVQEGHFSGDVDVCNPNQNFVTVMADVMVTETP